MGEHRRKQADSNANLGQFRRESVIGIDLAKRLVTNAPTSRSVFGTGLSNHQSLNRGTRAGWHCPSPREPKNIKVSQNCADRRAEWFRSFHRSAPAKPMRSEIRIAPRLPQPIGWSFREAAARGALARHKSIGPALHPLVREIGGSRF